MIAWAGWDHLQQAQALAESVAPAHRDRRNRRARDHNHHRRGPASPNADRGRQQSLVTPGKALKKLKDDPAIIRALDDYITEIEKLLQLAVTIIEVEAGDITRSHVLRQTHGMFVNDSINLACAERLEITDIVTRDADFKRIPNINSWEPTDV